MIFIKREAIFSMYIEFEIETLETIAFFSFDSP